LHVSVSFFRFAVGRCLVKSDGLKRPHIPLSQRLHVLKHSFPALEVFKNHVASVEADIIRTRKTAGGDRIIEYNQTEGVYSQRLETKLSAISCAGVQQAQRRIAAYRAFKEAEAATLLRRFQKDARLKQREHMRDTAAAIADVKDCLRGFATAFAKYVAVAARTQVFLDLAEYASLTRNYKQKLDKASCRIQRFVRYHMFRGKLMRQTRMIVAMRKIFWRPMLKILRKRRVRGTAVIRDSLVVMQSTGKVLRAIRYTNQDSVFIPLVRATKWIHRKFKSNVLAAQRAARVYNNITVARTLLLFMQIAVADRKRCAALRRIWKKKMEEVQAVMASSGRMTRVNRERVMVRCFFACHEISVHLRHYHKVSSHLASQMEQRMRVDRILDSMPDGAQHIQPIDHALILELAREKLTIMRLAHRQRVFDFHSQAQQSKSVSGLRASILSNFPQILEMYVLCSLYIIL
jgi:hypothetical protein